MSWEYLPFPTDFASAGMKDKLKQAFPVLESLSCSGRPAGLSLPLLKALHQTKKYVCAE